MAESLPVEGIGARIKALREAMKMTQAVVAAELGLRPATVSDWENGKAIPERGNLRLLADFVRPADAVYAWLMRGGDSMPSIRVNLPATELESPSRLVERGAGYETPDEPAEGPGFQFDTQLSDEELIDRMAYDRPGSTRYLRTAEFSDPRIPAIAKLRRIDFLERLARDQGKPLDPDYIDGLRKLISSGGLG